MLTKILSGNKKYILYSIFLILLDQITKAIFASRDFFIGPVHFMLLKNYGLPFAIRSSAGASFVIASAVLICLLAYFWKQRTQLASQEIFGLILIVSGAISNLADRVILGYVRDFIDLQLTFVFNFADAIIFIGIVMILMAPKARSTVIQSN